jgi:hypothetical protein
MASISKLAGWLALAVGLAVGAGPSPTRALEPVKTEDALIERVRSAMAGRDLEAISELINWQGAPPIRRRIVTFQINYGLGRPIKSILLEPLPEDALRAVEARGTLKANMPVTHRLRVVFDEAGEGGAPPSSVFLIGKLDGAFRIALVVRAKPPGAD